MTVFGGSAVVAFVSPMSFFDRLFRASKDEETLERHARAKAVLAKFAGHHPGSFSAPEVAEQREALTLFEKLSDFESMRELARRLGDTQAEARALQELGDIEALEALLSKEAEEQRAALSMQSATKDAEAFLEMGQRVAARAAFERAIAIAPEDAALAAAFADLRAVWLGDRRCSLVAGDRALRVVGHSPVTLGRDGDVVVRGATVSRVHASLSHDGEGWFVEDSGSRHGTFVEGFPLGARYRVDERGVELTFGSDAVVRLSSLAHGALSVTVIRGQNRGSKAFVGLREIEVDGMATMDFFTGVPRLRAQTGGAPWGLLNGVSSFEAELLAGDLVTLGGTAYRVDR